MKVLLFLLIAVACLSCADQKNNVKKHQSSPVREDIEWLDVWLPNTNDSLLPRVLFIGNSITRLYYPEVNESLKGMAYGARLSTSKSIGDPALLDEVALILQQEHFDVVHFNNGMHGEGYTEEQYQAAFPELVKTIRKYAPQAKLIWASTTPVRCGGDMADFHPKTERIRERNRIAAECVAGQDIQINDLFGLVENHPEYYAGGDGTHPVDCGVSALAEQVSLVVKEVLNSLNK